MAALEYFFRRLLRGIEKRCIRHIFSINLKQKKNFDY